MMGTMAEQLQDQFNTWFQELQHLTDEPLTPEEWTGRWYDGYSPAEALADGPEED
jgi:hypothetical protein